VSPVMRTQWCKPSVQAQQCEPNHASRVMHAEQSLIPMDMVGIYVTARAVPHSIVSVPAAMFRARWAGRSVALTKRRAVDFCRVTTAICPAG
jgi:hypothetical protein